MVVVQGVETLNVKCSELNFRQPILLQYPLVVGAAGRLEGMVVGRAQHLGQLRGQLEAGRELEAAQLLESLGRQYYNIIYQLL